MKLRTRFLGGILTAALVCGLLGACGEKMQPADDAPVVRLAVRSGIYSEVIKNCIVGFEEENGVRCELFELGEEELHSLLLKNAGNASGDYDLCMVDGSWMAEYTKAGVLADLTALGYEMDEDIIPATKEVCYSGGRTYLVPFYGNVTVLLYNKAMIRDAGYEESDIGSLDSMLAICKQEKTGGNYGFMYRGDSDNNYVVDFLPILLSYGGWVVDDQNRPTVNTKEFGQAMVFYLELIETGKAASKEDLITAIANGAAAMAIGWPGWYTPHNRSAADYCALDGKIKKDSDAYNANVYGIWTLGIPANSAKKELAARLLAYLTDAGVQRDSVHYGGVPCRYSSLQDESVIREFPQYRAVCRALETGIYRPIMAEWPEFCTILGRQMQAIIGGEKGVTAGLADAQAQLEELFKNEG